LCTACERELLFSYRKEGAQSGRMMAVIGIRGARGSSQSTAEANSRQLKVERKG
jgi:Multi-copper polyphenol oxidoreductase laccase